MWRSPNFVGAAGAENKGKDNMDFSLMSFWPDWLIDWVSFWLCYVPWSLWRLVKWSGEDFGSVYLIDWVSFWLSYVPWSLWRLVKWTGEDFGSVYSDIGLPINDMCKRRSTGLQEEITSNRKKKEEVSLNCYYYSNWTIAMGKYPQFASALLIINMMELAKGKTKQNCLYICCRSIRHYYAYKVSWKKNYSSCSVKKDSIVQNDRNKAHKDTRQILATSTPELQDKLDDSICTLTHMGKRRNRHLCRRETDRHTKHTLRVM
jgi:hypothetical protein